MKTIILMLEKTKTLLITVGTVLVLMGIELIEENHNFHGLVIMGSGFLEYYTYILLSKEI